jgi:hypothetical protein
LYIALRARNADITVVTGNIDIALVDPCIVADSIVRDERLCAASIIHIDPE